MKMDLLKNNRSIQTILIEIFSVVFGVLLALGINEWRENLANQQAVNEIMQNIKSEIVSNIDFLEKVYENNQETVRLASADTLEEKVDGDRTIVPGIQLQETAWKTLMSTGISQHLDYDTLYRLSQAYSLQENYKKVSMSLVQAAMNTSAYTAANKSTIDNDSFTHEFLDYFTMIVQMEAQLLKTYKDLTIYLDINTSENKLQQNSVQTKTKE